MTKKMIQMFAQAQDRRLRDAHTAAKKAITDLDKKIQDVLDQTPAIRQ